MLARTLAVTTLCAAATALVPAVPASAAGLPLPIATVAHKYVVADMVVTQGDTLTLVNSDIQVHDVYADDYIGGQPAFQSAIVGPGGTAKVFRVEFLQPSVYPFHCSVHEDMVGTLTVLGVEN